MITFLDWAKQDTKDTRKINYTFKCKSGLILEFTSDEYVSSALLGHIREALIESIKLVNNEWYAVLIQNS